jgi:hypothetical protein
VKAHEKEILEHLIYACKGLIRPFKQVWPVDGPPVTHPAYDAYHAAIAALDDAEGLIRLEVSHDRVG